jgi:hypothetical protein
MNGPSLANGHYLVYTCKKIKASLFYKEAKIKRPLTKTPITKKEDNYV